MKVLSKSLAAMVAAATLVGGGAFAVAGTAYAADNDAITVTPNPWYANSFDGWGTSLAWFANATGSLGEESAITTNLGDDASKAKAVEYGSMTSPSPPPKTGGLSAVPPAITPTSPM